MELVVERASLLNSLAMVQGIVERRNTVPILGHVLLEPNGGGSLRLLATDLEVGIRTEVSCESADKGTITLNARWRLGGAKVRAGAIQDDGARPPEFPGDAVAEHQGRRGCAQGGQG
jgi:hypothetical protein